MEGLLSILFFFLLEFLKSIFQAVFISVELLSNTCLYLLLWGKSVLMPWNRLNSYKASQTSLRVHTLWANCWLRTRKSPHGFLEKTIYVVSWNRFRLDEMEFDYFLKTKEAFFVKRGQRRTFIGTYFVSIGPVSTARARKSLTQWKLTKTGALLYKSAGRCKMISSQFWRNGRC